MRTKGLRCAVYLLDSQLVPVDEIQGECISGNISVDASSETRRTCSLTLYSKERSYHINEYNKIWFRRRVKVRLGLIAPASQQTFWYDMGIFVFNTASYTCSADTRTISLQCGDLTTLLDGTHGGILDSSAFSIQAGSDIQKIIEDLLNIHTDIREYRIGTIGEYDCLRGKSISWKQNRMDSGSSLEVVNLQEADDCDYLSDSPYLDEYEVLAYSTGNKLNIFSSEENIVYGVEVEKYIDLGSWHMLPCDLSFSGGTPLYDILVKLRDLYPGYESYFDKDGQFILNLIPTCEHDPLLLDYSDLQPLVIEETFNRDFTSIKNATRIYGKSIEVERYAKEKALTFREYSEDGTVLGYILELHLEKLSFSSGLKIGFQFPHLDTENLDTSLPLYLQLNACSSKISPSGELTENLMPNILPCCTKNTVIHSESSPAAETVYSPMPLSQFLPEESYCFQYIKNQSCMVYLGMYQVEAYVEDQNPESPFSVDKIGVRLQVLSGGEYDNITDINTCRERAEYENWLAGRLNDTATLNCVLIPFLDMNQKVRYRTFSTGETYSYIIKNLQFSLTDCTCSITMSRFYDLYPFILCGSAEEPSRNQ